MEKFQCCAVLIDPMEFMGTAQGKIRFEKVVRHLDYRVETRKEQFI
jgi:hypothetical protein